MKQAVVPVAMRYAYAMAVVFAALAVRWLLDPWLGQQVPFITLFAGVALVAWQAGPGPATLATLVGLLAAQMWVLAPPQPQSPGLVAIVLVHVLYLASCALIIVLGALARRRGEQAERSAERLRRSEGQLQLIVDALPMLISYVDVQQRYQFNSGMYERWFGHGREQIQGKHLREVLGESAYEAVRPAVEQALAGQTIRFETEIAYPHAGLRQVSVVYLPHRVDGEVAGFFALVEDISERRRAEHARAHLAAIFESADDAVVSKTLQGRITSWNAGAERLFGYSAEQIIGRSVETLIPDDLKQEEQQILAQLRRGERLKHFETERLTSTGKRIPVSLTVSPIHDDSGRIIGASKIARDISERRIAEQQQAAAERRKDEFLATLSHELRNPLAPILNSVEVMRRIHPIPDALQTARDIIDRQARHMSRLVDDLLDLSRISRGRIELKRRSLDLATTLHAAVEACQPMISAAGQQLRLDLPARPLEVDGDPTRLAQVFGNLLGNASKYTAAGGELVLAAAAEDGAAVVRVRDSGVGIEAQMLDQVFEMFVQAHHSIERSQAGLGIGLTLARQLVHLHGGSIAAHSAGRGRGSEFIVRLPLLDDGAGVPAAEPQAAAAAQPGRRLTVLLADDNPDITQSMGMLLELSGYAVHTVPDGVQAVQAAAELRPDVVLLDIGMPGLDGLEAALRIRALPDGARMRLIALTGWGQSEDRRRAQDVGFDAHCTKPVDFAQLQQLMTAPVLP